MSSSLPPPAGAPAAPEGAAGGRGGPPWTRPARLLAGPLGRTTSLPGIETGQQPQDRRLPLPLPLQLLPHPPDAALRRRHPDLQPRRDLLRRAVVGEPLQQLDLRLRQAPQ